MEGNKGFFSLLNCSRNPRDLSPNKVPPKDLSHASEAASLYLGRFSEIFLADGKWRMRMGRLRKDVQLDGSVDGSRVIGSKFVISTTCKWDILGL